VSVEFVADNLIKIGDVEFDLDWSATVGQKSSSDRRYILLKSPKIIRTYVDYFKTKPFDNLFEIGIQKGGSVAFFNLLFRGGSGF